MKLSAHYKYLRIRRHGGKPPYGVLNEGSDVGRFCSPRQVASPTNKCPIMYDDLIPAPIMSLSIFARQGRARPCFLLGEETERKVQNSREAPCHETVPTTPPGHSRLDVVGS